MRNGLNIAAIIPAWNEAPSIGKVIAAIPEWVDDIVVADNGSTDGTGELARAAGARVVVEPRRGYGSACLRGIAALDCPDVVVFLDADFSDHPEQMDRLVDPIMDGEAEFVVGSRVSGTREAGALTPQARFGNWLACWLMRGIWGVHHTDLGPFRAIRYRTLLELEMGDPDYGWTVEMQIKAAVHGVRTLERPVDYRKRVGRSKVSGTVRGVVGAGYKILGHIFVGALRRWMGRKTLEREAIIVFTRYPEPGETKTRMIPALGAEGAAALQRSMTTHTAREMASVPGRINRVVRYVGGDEERMRAWLGDSFVYLLQGEGDLGARMARAFSEAFDDKAVERVVIVGSDCPDLRAGILRAALDSLRTHDIVLGPATDGGYYLIGLRRNALENGASSLFADVDWGTETVYATTVVRAEQIGLRLRVLAPLDDVDRPEDLPVWERSRSKSGPLISVIVSTLNEAASIRATLEHAMVEDAEVIVVDGDSGDETAAIARELGATVYTTERGRARQLNFGSAKASGEVFLFLHGDTLLPKDFATRVQEVIDAGARAGAFQFATDDHSATMRWMARWANRRSRWLGMPYGDQGLFVTKDLFRAMGGFAEWPIMEDFDFVRRLRRVESIRIVDDAVTTSARRWQRLGPWRTMMRNQLIVIAWYLGVSPHRLAAYYHKRRNDRGAWW